MSAGIPFRGFLLYLIFESVITHGADTDMAYAGGLSAAAALGAVMPHQRVG